MISKNEVFDDENELKWLPYTTGKGRENMEQAFNNLMFRQQYAYYLYIFSILIVLRCIIFQLDGMHI